MDSTMEDQLLALAQELERNAGHGGHWTASMRAAAGIREILAAPGQDPVSRQHVATITALAVTR